MKSIIRPIAAWLFLALLYVARKYGGFEYASLWALALILAYQHE